MLYADRDNFIRYIPTYRLCSVVLDVEGREIEFHNTYEKVVVFWLPIFIVGLIFSIFTRE